MLALYLSSIFFGFIGCSMIGHQKVGSKGKKQGSKKNG
jgi:hypothetical protein